MCATVEEWVHAIGAHWILIFLRSMANSRFHESMFCHYVASPGCLMISTSCLCFSLCHRNNSDSLFVNQCVKREMIGKYQNTLLGPSFFPFLLKLSSSSPSFLWLNHLSPQIGHFSMSSYSGPRYRIQSFLHMWIFSTSKPNKQIICFAS
jgi:hypothetical protein